jgi:hypothetical protein
MEVPSLGVSNLTLAIVDTPGFFDDRGAKQDQENMVTIIQYKNAVLGSHYPNLILMAIQVKLTIRHFVWVQTR